jgi:hypothetical protein
MVNILFDKGITSAEDKTVLVDISNLTKTLIASKGTELKIEMLDAFESRKVDDSFKICWDFPIKTQSLITTIDMIIQLLNGTWASEDQCFHYTGFPNKGDMLEI